MTLLSGRTESEADARALERRAPLAFTLPDFALPVLLLFLLTIVCPMSFQMFLL